jgi:hypothetical protein
MNHRAVGAFPDPKVSITTPLIPGAFKTGFTAAGVIPGKIFRILTSEHIVFLILSLSAETIRMAALLNSILTPALASGG